METISIIQAIEECKDRLSVLTNKCFEASTELAQVKASYTAKFAKTAVMLKNGRECEFEGEIVKNPPVSNIDKIVKGLLYTDGLKVDVAEAKVVDAKHKREDNKTELSSLQTILKFVDTM